ncbi:MAG: DinB family protein [Phycisphaerae bacterium]|nr:DinB family protein [Phycisphaerae bacterium]
MSSSTQPSPVEASSIRPEHGEYSEYFEHYLALVPETELLGALYEECERTLALLRPLPEEQGEMRHPPYTWTVRQVVGHIVDTERIFAYRALRIARGDSTPLAGFEENSFAQVAERDGVRLPALLDDYEACRIATIAMLRALPDAAWRRRGIANNHAVSVRAIAWVILGHERHHTRILRSRLGVTTT